MATVGVVKRGRRTQEQRSAEMRVRLLDATIDCLVEFGYSGTTTPRVAERAGVTRGAQVHHFRSKTDLVVAAIEHLATKRMESAIKEIGSITASADPVSSVLDLMWEIHQGPMFAATVELWVAGRTDRALAAEMERLEPMVNNSLVVTVSQVLPDDAFRKEFLSFVYTVLEAIRGILIASFVDSDPGKARRRWERTRTNLTPLAGKALEGWDASLAAQPSERAEQ